MSSCDWLEIDPAHSNCSEPCFVDENGVKRTLWELKQLELNEHDDDE